MTDDRIKEIWASLGITESSLDFACAILAEHPAQDVKQEPVGETGTMPGTNGFTMACFEAAKVPVGSKLYGAPVPCAKAEPVGVVTVGPFEHGPFNFDVTPYGADHLPDGETKLYDHAAPCSRCAELAEESEYYRVNRDISGHAYLDMLNQRNELVDTHRDLTAKLAEAERQRDEYKALLVQAREALRSIE